MRLAEELAVLVTPPRGLDMPFTTPPTGLDMPPTPLTTPFVTPPAVLFAPPRALPPVLVTPLTAFLTAGLTCFFAVPAAGVFFAPRGTPEPPGLELAGRELERCAAGRRAVLGRAFTEGE